MNVPLESNISHSKLYDLGVINKMCRGNEEQVLKMVKVFIDQFSASIKEIENAYSENDFLKLKSLAHKFKPLLTYFGAAKLEQEFLLTEELILKETASLALELKITSLNLMTKEVINEIKKDFNITHK
jgi:HPt (histidine-containing phosphotransfer) domain-containing protein